MHVHGNATAVVAHRYAAIGVNRHVDKIRMTGQRFVDPVIDDLVHHMVQTAAVIGVTDIHTGALAHRFETLQNLDGIRTIFCGILLGFSHVTLSVIF